MTTYASYSTTTKIDRQSFQKERLQRGRIHEFLNLSDDPNC